MNEMQGRESHKSRWIDWLSEDVARVLARNTSRRGFLGRVGTLLVGASILPLLPVARGEDSGDADPGDPQSCDYWRYCGIDGTLCSCCGGSNTQCPPGTEPSKISWLGTCRNPADGRDYVIAYHDCCGKSLCPRCYCFRNEGDEPTYRPSKSNEINWCAANGNFTINCSLALIVGVAPKEP